MDSDEDWRPDHIHLSVLSLYLVYKFIGCDCCLTDRRKGHVYIFIAKNISPSISKYKIVTMDGKAV